MTQPTALIDVGFPAERSIARWERRHRDGEVPGVWPYGLDALRAFAQVRAVDLPTPGRVDRLRGRAGLAPRPIRDAIGVTWDENAALRMQTVRPYAIQASGVIWLTDAAARGGDLGRMPSALARSAALWVLSEAQLAPLRELVPGPAVGYVRFGIDHEFFPPQPYPDTPRVVSVGGDRDRDAVTLFRALSLVHSARPDVELIVQTASDLSPPDGVTVVAHLPHLQLRELYASASAVAIATRPNLHVSGMTVSLEAMATGRPVVATRTPGMADYVRDGETGLLSDPGEPETLARNVLALLDDRSRAEAIGATGRRSVEERFTSAHMAESIFALIRRFV